MLPSGAGCVWLSVLASDIEYFGVERPKTVTLHQQSSWPTANQQVDTREKDIGSYVYVLPSRICDLVKIGKANSVFERARAFGVDSIDIGSSYALHLASAHDAVHLEKTLHRTFRKWAVSKEEALQKGVRGDGATEWFSGACLALLRDYLVANADIFGFTIVSSDAFAEPFQGRMACGVPRDKRSLELDNVHLRQKKASVVSMRASQDRLTNRAAKLELQFSQLAVLLEQRMLAVDASSDAVFLGCAMPYERRFQLLFISRSSFQKGERDSVLLDLHESDICADGYSERLITSWACLENRDFTLEQVNVLFPANQSTGGRAVWPQFSKFVERLHTNPLGDHFFETTPDEIIEAADCFFEAKGMQSGSLTPNTRASGGRMLSLFDEGASLKEIENSHKGGSRGDLAFGSSPGPAIRSLRRN